MPENSPSPFDTFKARKITDFLRIEHGAATPQTEIGLVLGNFSASPAVAMKAAELYRAGAFEDIIVSGGVEIPQTPMTMEIAAIWNRQHGLPLPASGELEAHYLHRALVDHLGVPAKRIKIEDHSLKTVDNIRHTRDNYGLDRVESLTLVNITPANRRGLATARQFLGEEPVIVTQGTFLVPGVTWTNWARHDNAPPVVTRHIHEVVENEFLKLHAEPPAIPPYIARGLCAPIDIAKELERMQGLSTCPTGADRGRLTARCQRGGLSVA